MLFTEFQTQTKRLVNVYGQAKYPQERLDMIYNALKYIDAKSFGDQVSQFIGQSDKAPMLGEFMEAFRSVLGDMKKTQHEAKEKLLAICIKCGGSGVEPMYSKKNGFCYAFKCTCERGEMYAHNYPKQYDSMGNDYASHRAWVAGRFEEKNKIIRSNAKDFINEQSSAEDINQIGKMKKPQYPTEEELRNGKF